MLTPPYHAFLSTNRPRQFDVQTCVMRFHSLRLGKLYWESSVADSCEFVTNVMDLHRWRQDVNKWLCYYVFRGELKRTI